MRSALLLLVCAAALRAQDPFEIIIFEYDPLPFGMFTYETHLNYVLDGTKGYDGAVAPTQDQLHYSTELTMGLTESIRAGVVVMTAHRAGGPWEYVGFRLLPHFYAPRSWGLPVNLGFVAEYSSERPGFDDDTRTLELRGIVEKHIGRLQLDGNLVFGRGLRGSGTREGWDLEPSGRVGWKLTKKFTPSLEYYASMGPVNRPLPRQQQIQLLFPGADWNVTEHLKWSFGMGFGLTDASNRVTLKSRLEYEFGGRKH
jgi:hypothetical protein